MSNLIASMESAAVATTTFADRLAEAVVERHSQLVVGLDPRLDLLPLELRGDAHVGRPPPPRRLRASAAGSSTRSRRTRSQSSRSSRSSRCSAPTASPPSSEVCGYARAAGLLVIADGKRGDIGSTARAYADAYLEPGEGRDRLADALTVNPYLGRDSLEPFVAACRRGGGGIFCLVKTSNAGSSDVQDLALSDGRPLWHQVADLVRELGEELVGECGLSSVGAVVGATHPRAVGEARRLLPQAILLLPGVGAQGATPADIARAFTSGPASALVNASRSVMYAFREGEDLDWRAAAAAEAARLNARGMDGFGLVDGDRGRAVAGAGRLPARGDRGRARSCAPRCARTSLPATTDDRGRGADDHDAPGLGRDRVGSQAVLRDPERRHARRDRRPLRDVRCGAPQAEPGDRADRAPPGRARPREVATLLEP